MLTAWLHCYDRRTTGLHHFHDRNTKLSKRSMSVIFDSITIASMRGFETEGKLVDIVEVVAQLTLNK